MDEEQYKQQWMKMVREYTDYQKDIVAELMTVNERLAGLLDRLDHIGNLMEGE
jgi:hypothetical protein